MCLRWHTLPPRQDALLGVGLRTIPQFEKKKKNNYHNTWERVAVLLELHTYIAVERKLDIQTEGKNKEDGWNKKHEMNG